MVDLLGKPVDIKVFSQGTARHYMIWFTINTIIYPSMIFVTILLLCEKWGNDLFSLCKNNVCCVNMKAQRPSLA